MHKPLLFKALDLPALLATARTLPVTGILSTTETTWTYLDIDDAYIHQLFPLLESHHHDIDKPDYFSNNSAGAHITVIYPEEHQFVHHEDLGKQHSFTVAGAFSADLGLKRYYILTVESASLLALRNKYGLSDQLCFKNHLINLHITIGTAFLRKNMVK